MLRLPLGFLILGFAICFLPGCIHYYDVSHDSRFPSGYSPDKTYVLLRDVLMGEDSEPDKWGVILFLSPTEDRYIAEALQKAKTPAESGVALHGTRMKFVRLTRAKSVDMDSVSPQLLLLDGPYAGKTVSGLLISKKSHEFASGPDPDYLGTVN